jgi:hypothetical protein
MDSRKLATATLLGVLIAVVKAPFPFPISDLLNIVEVPLLALSFLILGMGGAAYAGLVNGMLSSVFKVGFFPYDLVFGVSYGFLVDLFCGLLKVREEERINSRRLMAALSAASVVLGLGITYFSLAMNLNPNVSFPGFGTAELIEVVYLPTVAWGILSGAVGAYVSARVWHGSLRGRLGPG